MTVASRIRQTHERGSTPAEIVNMTNITKSQIENESSRQRRKELSDLELTARRWMYRPPQSWWTGTDDAWRELVRANFGDALGPPRNIECRV